MVEVKEEVIENLVHMQDIFSSLAVKVDELSKNVAHLLTLFDEASKSFHEIEETDKETPAMLKNILEQNKIIARALTILEERLRNQQPQPPQQPAQQYQYPQYPPSYQQIPPYQPPAQQYKPQPTTNKMLPSVSVPKPQHPITATPTPDKKPKPLPTEAT